MANTPEIVANSPIGSYQVAVDKDAQNNDRQAVGIDIGDVTAGVWTPSRVSSSNPLPVTAALSPGTTVDVGTITGPVALPTGAATEAKQTQPGVDIGDVTINNTGANPVPTNLAQVAGTATAVNAGNASAGTQRVVLATDQSFPFAGAVGSTTIPPNTIQIGGEDQFNFLRKYGVDGNGSAITVQQKFSTNNRIYHIQNRTEINISTVTTGGAVSLNTSGIVVVQMATSFVSVALTGVHTGLSVEFQVLPTLSGTWKTCSLLNQETGVYETGFSGATNVNNVWKGELRGYAFQISVTAIASGSVTGVSYANQVGADPCPVVRQGGTWNVGLNAGTNNIGDVDVLSLPSIPAGTNNIGDVDVLSLPGIAGDVANDAADSGNPVKIGGKAKTADPTAVSNDDRVNALFDKLGKQVILSNALLEKTFSATSASSITNTTSTSLVAATASVIRVITAITVSNMHATVSTIVNILDGSTVKWHGPAAAVGGGYCVSGLKLVGTVNTAINVQCVTTGASVRASVEYFEIAG